MSVFLCACVCVVHLKERLEEYIKQWNGLVKLFRNEKREGLIQARSIGARKATKGQVSYELGATVSVQHKTGSDFSESQQPRLVVFVRFLGPDLPGCSL